MPHVLNKLFVPEMKPFVLSLSKHRLIPLLISPAFIVILLVPQSLAENSADAVPKSTVETALVSVAKHLSPPYALYLYESLARQILSNERVMERLDSPQSPMASDSLWALDIISRSIMVEGQDGQYVDVRLIPSFFTDVAERYFRPSHYWPDQDITQDNRREHLAAWYAMYLMLLVANETQDEIARVLQDGIFERRPPGLEAGGPSLVDRLHREGVLSQEAYELVRIKKSGTAGREKLDFPAYLDQWKAKISKAYGSK
jgi:hypothetical protein